MADLPASIEAKMERAYQHLKDLSMEAWQFRGRYPNIPITDDDWSEASSDQLWRVVIQQPIPVSIPLILGDAVHNLRSALDHLTCALVERNGGTVDHRIAFPIWNPGKPTAHQYETYVKRKVHGAHRQTIERFLALEPYEGGDHDTLWALDYLDRIDKHRLLLVIHDRVHQILYTPRAEDRYYFIQPLSPGPLVNLDPLLTLPKGQVKTDDEIHFLFDIALGEPSVLEGESIVKAVSDLSQTVREFIGLLWW